MELRKSMRLFSIDRKGAAAIEHMLILGLVLGLFLFVFWSTVAERLESKLQEAGFDVKIPFKKKPKSKAAATEETGTSGGGVVESGGPTGFGGGSGGETTGSTIIPSTGTLRSF